MYNFIVLFCLHVHSRNRNFSIQLSVVMVNKDRSHKMNEFSKHGTSSMIVFWFKFWLVL